jgi:hypothetical protein
MIAAISIIARTRPKSPIEARWRDSGRFRYSAPSQPVPRFVLFLTLFRSVNPEHAFGRADLIKSGSELSQMRGIR